MPDFDYLSKTADNAEVSPRQRMADLEAITPGTGEIILDLLKHPLFKNHPYANVPFPQDRPQSDKK